MTSFRHRRIGRHGPECSSEVHHRRRVHQVRHGNRTWSPSRPEAIINVNKITQHIRFLHPTHHDFTHDQRKGSRREGEDDGVLDTQISMAPHASLSSLIPSWWQLSIRMFSCEILFYSCCRRLETCGTESGFQRFLLLLKYLNLFPLFHLTP